MNRMRGLAWFVILALFPGPSEGQRLIEEPWPEVEEECAPGPGVMIPGQDARRPTGRPASTDRSGSLARCASVPLPQQLEPKGFRRLCEERRPWVVIGGGAVVGAAAVVLAKALGATSVSEAVQSDGEIFGVSFLTGAAVIGLGCWVTTGRLWSSRREAARQ